MPGYHVPTTTAYSTTFWQVSVSVVFLCVLVRVRCFLSCFCVCCWFLVCFGVRVGEGELVFFALSGRRTIPQPTTTTCLTRLWPLFSVFWCFRACLVCFVVLLRVLLWFGVLRRVFMREGDGLVFFHIEWQEKDSATCHNNLLNNILAPLCLCVLVRAGCIWLC